MEIAQHAILRREISRESKFSGWSAGFVALCINFLITTVLSLITQAYLPPLDAESSTGHTKHAVA
jgi:hypothetical protein